MFVGYTYTANFVPIRQKNFKETVIVNASYFKVSHPMRLITLGNDKL